MKNITVIIALSVSISACVSSNADVNQKLISHVVDGFNPSEVIVSIPDKRVFPGKLRDRSAKVHVRQGSIGNGLTYQVSRKGSVSIRQKDDVLFSSHCGVDQMTDRKTCRIGVSGPSAGFGDIGGMLDISGRSMGVLNRVCVIGHDFPGENARIRVDGHRFFTLPEGCLTSRTLVGQLLSGSVALVDYSVWPYGYSYRKIDLTGIEFIEPLIIYSRKVKTP